MQDPRANAPVYVLPPFELVCSKLKHTVGCLRQAQVMTLTLCHRVQSHPCGDDRGWNIVVRAAAAPEGVR